MGGPLFVPAHTKYLLVFFQSQTQTFVILISIFPPGTPDTNIFGEMAKEHLDASSQKGSCFAYRKVIILREKIVIIENFCDTISFQNNYNNLIKFSQLLLQIAI